jgi:phospholipid/cholesterol/gamma-HCH transport system substrate-binding protein
MEERDKKTELLVGLFLLIGLLLISGLILEFSSVREIFKSTYTLTALFPDGTGINDSTPVMLGGSRVGKVKDKPTLNDRFDGVIIILEIYNTVHIPLDAKFTIGTAGLLGDSFIEIKPSGKETTDYVKPGAVIEGEANKLSGLQNTVDRVAKKVDVALDDIRDTVKDLRTTLRKINDGALGEDSIKDLKETFKHINSMVTRLDEKTLGEETSKDVKAAIASFKDAAKSLEDTMKKLDPTVQKVNGVVDQAGKVMTSADSALKSIDKTANTLGDTARDLRKGNGLLPALINDEDLKRQFKQLIGNLKEHGVLFYKDSVTGKGADDGSHQRTRPRDGVGH